MANAMTLAASNPLAMMATSESTIEAQVKLPYVGFFSKRADKAVEIGADCKGIQEGEPYLSKPDGSFAPVTSVGLIGPTFRYGASLDSNYKITEACIGEPPRGDSKKDHVLAPLLAYTADGVTATLSTFRPTKVRACLDLVNGVARASDETVKAAGPIGKQLAALPQSLRTVGDVDVINKTSQAGFNYQLARCRSRLLSDVECEALGKALNDEDFNATCAAIQTAYDHRTQMITKVAEECA